MTGTIDDGFRLSGADPLQSDDEFREITEAAARLEQAKGVLIFRYAIGARTAFHLIQRWAAEARVDIETVAHALVHDICQGHQSESSDPAFVRWLEDQLRREFPTAPARRPEPVRVAVDQTDCSLDAVVQAARDASRRGLPLEVVVDEDSLRGVQRPQVMQRVDLAAQLARTVAPGVDVRVPADHLRASGD